MTSAPTLPLRAAIVAVTAFQQNCAIVWCTATMAGAVVDPGGDVARIRQAIAGTGAGIDKILLTHGHIDHAGGAAELAEALDVPIIGPHRDDDWLLESLPMQGAQFGMAGVRAVVPDRWLDEGDTVAVGEVTFEVLHCPGHTPGHVVFINREIGFGVMGDVLFQGSVGRTDFAGGDHQALLRSIFDKLLPLGDDVAFISGHGPTGTFGEEKRTNPFLT